MTINKMNTRDLKEKYRGGRFSNIELLRIIATFMVMVAHACFFSLGAPTTTDFEISIVPSLSKIFFQSLSICCVDIFILISGYFGIRPKVSSLLSFIYQIIFFFPLVYLVCIAFGLSEISIRGVLECFLLTPANWFIKAYLMLYVLSPILNAFVDLGNRRLHLMVLCGFYFIQTVYGCIFAADFFNNGYGALSFVGLYLLARYIRIYNPAIVSLKGNIHLMIFFGSAFLICLLSSLGYVIGRNFNILMFTFINPLVIVQSVALLLYFSKWHFHSSVVNWIAQSAFAAYLLHANPNILRTFFKGTVLSIHNNYEGVLVLVNISIFLIILFIAAVLIDQIRKMTYEFIFKEICNR